MMSDAEWDIFFQSFWVQNVMALIFAIILFVILCFELLTKDEPLYIRVIPKEKPPLEVFCSDDQ